MLHERDPYDNMARIASQYESWGVEPEEEPEPACIDCGAEPVVSTIHEEDAEQGLFCLACFHAQYDNAYDCEIYSDPAAMNCAACPSTACKRKAVAS